MMTRALKIKFAKIILAVASLSAFSACGTGVASDGQYTAQQQKDAEALNAQYGKAVGTYAGVLNSTSAGLADLPARLELYVLQIDQGSNPDGTHRSQPVLMGRFRLENIVSATDYTSMVGKYDAHTSGLDLSPSPTGVTAAPLDTTSILVSGTVGADSADVIVRKQGRKWGHFTGTRISPEVMAPVSNDETERRDRLYSIYRNIEGNYEATLDTGTQQRPVSMTISIKEKAGDSPGVTIPVLVAQYRRKDVLPSIGEYQLAVSYDQLSNLMSMIATAGGSSAIPGSDYLSAAGTWTNGTLDVVLRDRNGYAGSFVAVRKPFRK